MKRLNGNLRRLVHDERGGETMEYALILGGISLVALAVIAAFGPKVVAVWNTVDAMK